MGSSCGLGLDEPQVRAVRLMATVPPSNRGAAGGGAGTALRWATMEGLVEAE